MVTFSGSPLCVIIQWPYWPEGINGFSFWPFIFYDDGPDKDRNRTIIEHEKTHIRQQLRGLLVIFYIKYIYYHFKLGYDDNPYEIEAKKHERDWM